MSAAEGGLYVYIRDCFGRLPAFLYGWTLFLVIASGSVATLAVAFSTYLGEVVRMPPLVAKIVSVAMITVVTAVNALGTRQSADLQDWTTLIKVSAILAMSAVLFSLGRNYSDIAPPLLPAHSSRSLLFNFGVGMISGV